MTESKLPRGSFFYISVGHLFYGGKRPLTQQVQVHHTVMQPRQTRWSTWLRGWQPHKPHCRPVLMGSMWRGKAQTVTLQTGVFEDILTSTIAEAKQFRRRSQAQAVLEHLTRTHADMGVVPRMGLQRSTQ